MNYGIAIAFMAGGFLSLALMHLMRDKCQHEWKFLHTLEGFRNTIDTIPKSRHKVYQCTKCLESKKVGV